MVSPPPPAPSSALSVLLQMLLGFWFLVVVPLLSAISGLDVSAGIASIPVFDLQINDFKPSSSAVEQRGPSCSAATPLGVQIHEKNPDRNKENLTSAAKEAAYLSTLLSKFAKLIILLPVKHQMSASAR